MSVRACEHLTFGELSKWNTSRSEQHRFQPQFFQSANFTEIVMRVLPILRKIFQTNLKTIKNHRTAASYLLTPSYELSDLNARSVKSTERDYLRSILAKCGGCILHEPAKNFGIRELILSSGTSPTSDAGTHHTPSGNLYDDDLMNRLSVLARNDTTPDRKRVSQLEKQCVKEYKLWPVEKQLLVLDMWLHVPSAHLTRFAWLIRNDLLSRVGSLSRDHALQTVYYASRLPNRMDETHKKIVETRFEEGIIPMTLEAMSVWCLAMFRNQAPFTSQKLINEIFSKLLKYNLKGFHRVGLCSVLKVCARRK